MKNWELLLQIKDELDEEQIENDSNRSNETSKSSIEWDAKYDGIDDGLNLAISIINRLLKTVG